MNNSDLDYISESDSARERVSVVYHGEPVISVPAVQLHASTSFTEIVDIAVVFIKKVPIVAHRRNKITEQELKNKRKKTNVLLVMIALRTYGLIAKPGHHPDFSKSPSGVEDEPRNHSI